MLIMRRLNNNNKKKLNPTYGEKPLENENVEEKKQRSVNKYVAKTKFCCKTDIGRQKTEELREKGIFYFNLSKNRIFI